MNTNAPTLQRQGQGRSVFETVLTNARLILEDEEISGSLSFDAAGIRAIGSFEVSVGLYPHVHPESPSIDHDIDVLKAKIDAGATRAITQFFFDLDGFLRFMDRVRKAGVTIPISPGIMPVTNFKGLKKMAGPIGIQLPAWLANLFEGLDKDPDTRRLLACSVATETCARLAEEGFSDFHFYTLNRADLTYAICRVLGVREPEKLKEVAA